MQPLFAYGPRDHGYAGVSFGTKGFTASHKSPQTVREEWLTDFGLSWCQNFLSNPAYEHFRPITRVSGNESDASYDTLMGKTLITSDTIRAIQYLYKPEDPNDEQAIGGNVVALISVRSDMCSHVEVLHGGINAVLVDEVGGALAGKEAPPGTPMMAVNFNVNLRKSVRTPGVTVGRAWFEKKPEGRKFWVKCTIEQDGFTCIDAECLYLKIKVDNSKL